MKNKIAKSNGILYKIRNFLDRKTLTHLYNPFVFPYLIYGVEVWGNSNTNTKTVILINLNIFCLL